MFAATAVLKGQTRKMGTVLIIFKIMPDTVDADLDEIEEKARKTIEKFGGTIGKAEKEPIAFGLVALKLFFSLDENKSNLEPLEENLRSIEGVASAEVIDVRRAIG